MTYNVREHSYVVGGLGVTGQACVRFLRKHNAKVKAFDTRAYLDLPGDLVTLMQSDVTTSSLKPEYFDGVDTLVLSPGLAMDIEQVVLAKQCGVDVIGDVELFARLNRSATKSKRVVGITGSNGKTTVTLLVNHLLNRCGVKSIEAGNVGRPVLEALESDTDVIVLELSSFQLETTSSLTLEAATVLNISDDHLDRHGSLESYINAKHRIFDNAKTAIVWRDGEFVYPEDDVELSPTHIVEYGLGKSKSGFAVSSENENRCVTFNESPLIDIADIPMAGTHNILNVMAALGICASLGISPDVAAPHISNFVSAPHRCVEIARLKGVRYIDDSKATNIGATIAALEGLGPVTSGKIILIAGGDAKGANMQSLAPYLRRFVKHVCALGKDADLIVDSFTKTTKVASMADAVALANELADEGDVVLLSPACASIDMFNNYMHRGEVFKQAVETANMQEVAL